MKHFVLLAVVAFSLSACKTTVRGDTPDVKVKGDGYELEIESDDHDGRFCPPGHAKKGWC